MTFPVRQGRYVQAAVDGVGVKVPFAGVRLPSRTKGQLRNMIVDFLRS